MAGAEAVVGADGAFTADGVELAEGDNPLTAVARDTFGHEATSEPVVYVLDTLPPEIADHGAARRRGRLRAPGRGESGPRPIPTWRLGVGQRRGGDAATRDGTFSATVPVVDGANLLTRRGDRPGGPRGVGGGERLPRHPAARRHHRHPRARRLPGGGRPVHPGRLLLRPQPGHRPRRPAAAGTGRGAGQRRGDPVVRGWSSPADGTRWSAGGVDLGTADGTATASIVATDVLGNASQYRRLLAPRRRRYRRVASDPRRRAVPGLGPRRRAGSRAPRPWPLNRDGGRGRGGRRTEPGAAAPRAVVTLDGAPYAPGTPITGEGEHLLVARASDCAGHEATVHAFFRIDRSPPALVSSEPAAGSRVSTEVTAFSGVASEPLASATRRRRDRRASTAPPSRGLRSRGPRAPTRSWSSWSTGPATGRSRR